MSDEDNLHFKILEERIEHIMDLIVQADEFLKSALELQAKEYDRRLDVLNHHADQLKEMQRKYVSELTYSEFKKAVDSQQQSLTEKVQTQSTWMATTISKLAVFDEFKRTTEQSIKDIREKEIAPIKNWKSSVDGKWALIAFLITIAMFVLNYIRK